ncbi:MAG: signal transduction histidine kinase [Phenylobacterium sp.]|jgi:signal transduction histidine kinase
MKSLFLRLYLLLIIAFLGIGWSLDQFIDSYANDEQLTSDIDLHQGTFFLLNKELKRLKPQQQASFISTISSSFGYAIGLTDATTLIQTLAFSQREITHLNDGGIVPRFSDEQGLSWFYHQLSDSEQVMVLGPIHYQTKSSPWLSVIFFTFIALVVFIWVWPIARGLKALTTAATAFGQGDFSVRAKDSNTAALMVLGERFNAMAERIQRLVESHKELSHGVSHELRTPIARLRFAMEMVREVDDKDKRHQYLDTMDNNIQELDGLVDELLVYARFDREEPKLDLAEFDIAEVVTLQLARFEQAEEQLAIVFEQQAQSNEAHNEAHSVSCRFDRGAICRVIDNLVRNAVRYAKTTITVRLILTSDQVCLQIDDDGPGIPQESRASLFKPFVRLDQSRDRNSGGIGLGLAIVKRLVELHQGSVEVTSADTGGARFIVRWPRCL